VLVAGGGQELCQREFPSLKADVRSLGIQKLGADGAKGDGPEPEEGGLVLVWKPVWLMRERRDCVLELRV
jgi:hypothetical protein